MYYQSGNKRKDAFNFEEFGTMANLFQQTDSGRITLKDAESKLIKFRNRLIMLKNTTARKKDYIEKKAEVFRNAESLFEGLKLIYSGFLDNIFGKHLMRNRSGGEESYFKVRSDDDDDEVPDFRIREMFENEELKFDKNLAEEVKLKRQRFDELNNMITKKDKITDKELFKDYFFQFKDLSDMQKKLYKARSIQKN